MILICSRVEKWPVEDFFPAFLSSPDPPTQSFLFLTLWLQSGYQALLWVQRIQREKLSSLPSRNWMFSHLLTSAFCLTIRFPCLVCSGYKVKLSLIIATKKYPPMTLLNNYSTSAQNMVILLAASIATSIKYLRVYRVTVDPNCKRVCVMSWVTGTRALEPTWCFSCFWHEYQSPQVGSSCSQSTPHAFLSINYPNPYVLVCLL